MMNNLVGLADYRLARRAADALVGLLHEPEWLVQVKVEVRTGGEPVVVALVSTAASRVKPAFPRSIDGVEVFVKSMEAGKEQA